MNLINQGLSTTQSRLYLITEDTFERLDIQFVPDKLRNNRRAEVNPVQIIGRNLPKYQNTGGEERLKLELDFIADEQSRSSVIQKVRWLKNLTYNNASLNPAQRVQLIFGELFRKELWVVEEVDAEIFSFSKPDGFLPQMASVKLTLCLDMDTNPNWDDINPSYAMGAPDGSNPVSLGMARASDESIEAQKFNNNNTFREMFARLGERLRFDRYGGYKYNQ